MSGGDAEDGEYCCGVDCGASDAVRLLITLRQNSNGTHWSTRVHRHHCAVARRFGQSFLQLRRYMFTTCSRERREKATFAWLSAFRVASMEWCRERPSMLFAWGSDESEQDSEGRAMSWDGGIELVEDAEESDFCAWDGIAAWCERLEEPRGMTRWVGERAGVVGGREQDARDGVELARVMGWVSEWQRRVWLDRGRDRAMARYFIGRWAQTRERAMTYFGSHLTNLCNWHIALPHRQSRVLTSPAPRGGQQTPKNYFRVADWDRSMGGVRVHLPDWA